MVDDVAEAKVFYLEYLASRAADFLDATSRHGVAPDHALRDDVQSGRGLLGEPTFRAEYHDAWVVGSYLDMYHCMDMRDNGLSEDEALRNCAVVICICDDGKVRVATARQLEDHEDTSMVVGSDEWHQGFLAISETDYLRDDTIIHFSGSEDEFTIPTSKDEVRGFVGLLVDPLVE